MDSPGMMVVGYVPGAFDMFHIGHLNILRRARALCDRLVVGVVTDEVLGAMKGRPPVIPFAERLDIVASIGIVDLAVPDTSSDKLTAWRSVHFDVLFKGDDWRGTPKGDRLEASLATVGVDVVYFPYTISTSSSVLREYLAASG